MVQVPRNDVLLRDNKVLLHTGWWQDQEGEMVNILDIVERLQNGDLTALNDLDKLKISYTEMDKNGAKIIVFKYDGVQYTIKCYAAEGGNEGPTAEFATFNDLQKYLISNEMKTTLENMGVSNFNYGFTYETIASTVAGKHQSDFASVTKEQLAQEFKAEYDKKVKEYNDSRTPKSEFNTLYALTQYTSSTTFRDAVLKKLELTLVQFEKNTGLSFANVVSQINNQHSRDFQSVTKEQLIEEAVTKYNSLAKAPSTKTEFATFNDLQKYLISNEMKTTLENMGVSNFNYDFTYETIANTVAAKHQSDFASVTKDQLAQEFKAEYDKKVKEYNDSRTPKSEFNTLYALTQFTSSNEFKYAVLTRLGLTSAQFEKNTGISFASVASQINNQHSRDFKSVTKEQLIEEAVAKYNSLAEIPSMVTTPTNAEFATFNDLRKYLISNEMKTSLKNMGVSNFNYGFTYETIANTVAAKHQSDFASVTKEQLAQEFKAEYDKKVKEYNDSRTPKAEFNSYIALNQYLQGADFKSAVLKQLGIKEEADVEKNCGVSFDLIVYVLSNNHSKDFASVTKNQLIQEAIEQYNMFVQTKGDEDPKANGPLSTAYDKIRKTVSSASNWIPGKLAEEISSTINLTFSTDLLGNTLFASSNTKTVYGTLVDKLLSEISNDERDAFLQQIGGKDVFKQIINAAWITSYNNYSSTGTWSTKSFISSVLTNLQNILTKLQTNPEYLEYFTNDCYLDTTLKESLTYVNHNVTSCKYQKDNKGYPKVYQSDGKIHLEDDYSDKLYQKTMAELLERIYNKYPDVAKSSLESLFLKAQKQALYSIVQSGQDIPKSCYIYGNSALMSSVINLILYNFDKLFKNECLTTVLPTRALEVPTTPETRGSSYTPAQLEDIKAGAKDVAIWAQDVADDIVGNCYTAIGASGKPTIHTEFGFDSSGNIVFQEARTTTVYNTIYEKLKAKISRFAPNGLTKLGGENVLKKLLQAAWITTYNTFNSSQGHSLANFVNKVMENLDKMLGKLQTNPELLEAFIKRGSYADTSLTSGLKHYNTNTTYGNDEIIRYDGNITIYDDGSVHISNTTDDDDYQVTMNALLERIKAKYTSVPTETLTAVFRNAQRMALITLQNNTFDCPYGTGNNGGRVEDASKNWGGKDNRKKDDGKIHMDQLVQITLYYFDKLLYQTLLK